MNASDWIALAGEAITVVGAGGLGVAKLTRIAEAAERLGRSVEQLGAGLETLGKTVTDHETRLNKANL